MRKNHNKIFLHQVGTSSLLIYMMHGHTYIKYSKHVKKEHT